MRTRRLHSSIPPEMSRMNAEVTQEPNQPPTPHLHIGVDICLLISTLPPPFPPPFPPPSLPPSLNNTQKISFKESPKESSEASPKNPAEKNPDPGQTSTTARATTTGNNNNQHQSTTINNNLQVARKPNGNAATLPLLTRLNTSNSHHQQQQQHQQHPMPLPLSLPLLHHKFNPNPDTIEPHQGGRWEVGGGMGAITSGTAQDDSLFQNAIESMRMDRYQPAR